MSFCRQMFSSTQSFGSEITSWGCLPVSKSIITDSTTYMIRVYHGISYIWMCIYIALYCIHAARMHTHSRNPGTSRQKLPSHFCFFPYQSRISMNIPESFFQGKFSGHLYFLMVNTPSLPRCALSTVGRCPAPRCARHRCQGVAAMQRQRICAE